MISVKDYDFKKIKKLLKKQPWLCWRSMSLGSIGKVKGWQKWISSLRREAKKHNLHIRCDVHADKDCLYPEVFESCKKGK